MDNQAKESQTEYKTVLELAISQAERDQLGNIKEQLGLRENDALWSVVSTLQLYVRTVEAFNSGMKDSVYDAVKTFGDRGGIIQASTVNEPERFSWIVILLGLSMVFVLCLICFIAGATLSAISPTWLLGINNSSGGLASTLHFLLSVPAGWIIIVLFAAPASVYLKIYYKYFKIASTKQEKNTYLAIAISLLLLIIIALAIFIKIMF